MNSLQAICMLKCMECIIIIIIIKCAHVILALLFFYANRFELYSRQTIVDTPNAKRRFCAVIGSLPVFHLYTHLDYSLTNGGRSYYSNCKRRVEANREARDLSGLSGSLRSTQDASLLALLLPRVSSTATVVHSARQVLHHMPHVQPVHTITEERRC